MANIRVDVNYTIKDGSEIVFRSPVDCTAITGLIVYYQAEDGNTTSKEFALADAHGNNVGDVPHLFAENVVVKVILDVTSGMAFVQNADTNAYLEGRFAELLPKLVMVSTSNGGYIADKTFTEIKEAYNDGHTVCCYYQGLVYPLVLMSEEAAAFMLCMPCYSCFINIYPDNTVEVVNYDGSITINGQTWNGDAPTDFTSIINAMIEAKAQTIPTALKNPNALTINGTSYDGSKAVSMTLGGDSAPEYIKTEADRVAKVVQSRQNANTITFLACSDIHYYSPDNATANANAEKMHEAVVGMGQAMGLIRERCHIDFAVMFGDMAWDYGETHDEILAEMRFVNSCLHKGFAGIPQFRMEGNHDDAYESGGNLTASEVFANIGAWNTGAVYGSRASGYCYRDFDSVKLRVICLNSSEYSGSAAQYNAEQVTWLAKALNLSEKGAGWRSIIIGHHPLDWGRNGGADPTATINAASGLIASFHGHIHNFLTGTVTNTDLPRIGIPNAGYSRENQYGESYGINWKESTTYSKTPGTATNTSFCVITIDTEAKKIYADHYGAGYDRVISYVDNGVPSYTNLVPTSLDPATGGIYNTNGYKNGKYASGAGESDDTACVLTGLIAYGEGRTAPIYIKGADVTTASHCRIICFNAAREASIQSAAGTSLTTYFTVETLGTSYYKLTPTQTLIDAAGQTDYLRFSLIGEGENLIITIDEPIE